MKRTAAGILCVLAAALFAAPEKPVEVMAVYYPHWHKYPKGTEWFGAGWNQGEWAFVKSPVTRFPGHINFKPFAGYLNGADPEDVATEIDLASNAGIDIFLYDYYWYNGQKTQEEAIEQGFLKAKNRSKMKFALMWCFHERVDSFRPPFDKTPKERRQLMTLARTPEEFLGLVDYSIAHYFSQPEYWRKDGRLFFSIYNAKDFVESLGADKARQALADARAKVRAAGLGEMAFNAQNPPNPAFVKTLKDVGFDSVTHYGCSSSDGDTWARYRGKGERLFDFADLRGTLLKRQTDYAATDLPYYPVVPTGWDSTLRCRPDVKFPWKHEKPNYPYCNTITNNTADLFETYLRDAKAAVEKDPKKPGVVYINAWNEYTEGCYLLPDMRRGDLKLRAIARVFGRRPAGRIAYTGAYHTWEKNPVNQKARFIDAPDLENVKYGPHERQGLDVWFPDKARTSGRKTPAVIVIHGGGWSMGERLPGAAGFVADCRAKGISLVTAGYRFIQDANDAGIRPAVKACLDDAVAAIRYVQAHADEWNIDVTRIGLTGGSAGACSSLYASLTGGNELGIRAVFAQSPQTSLDPQEMKAWIPNSNYGSHAFGYPSFNTWLARRAECLPWIEKFSPAGLLRACQAERAPAFFYTCPSLPPPGQLPPDPTHAAMFCIKFQEICRSKGIACHAGGQTDFLAALLADGWTRAPVAPSRRLVLADESRARLHYYEEGDPAASFFVPAEKPLWDLKRMGTSGTKGVYRVVCRKGFMVIDLDRRRVVDVFRHPSLDEVTAVCDLPDGGFIASVNPQTAPDKGKTVLLRRFSRTREPVATYRLDGLFYARSMQWDRDGETILLAWEKGFVRARLPKTGVNCEIVNDFRQPKGRNLFDVVPARGGSGYLAGCGYGGGFVRFDADGVARAQAFVPVSEGRKSLFYAQVQERPNGHVFMAHWTGHGEKDSYSGCQAVEFDANGKVVWTLYDPSRFGSVSGLWVLP